MDSTGSISMLSARMMPFLAILRHDLRTLSASWLVRLWLGATAVVALLLLAGNWGNFRTGPLVASLLFPYLVFPWSLVVMVLSVTPLSGQRGEAVADGLLSRPITRYEYLLASWSARIVLVLSVYLSVMVPTILIAVLAERPVSADSVTFYGIVGALSAVGLVMAFLVSLGFFLAVALRNQWLALVVLVFFWFPVNLVLNTFSLEELSPISLNQALPTLLRQPWSESDSTAQANQPDLDEMAQGAAALWDFIGGAPPKPVEPQGFFDREDFEDFQLYRVVLGYGLSSLLVVGLALLFFCWRDL